MDHHQRKLKIIEYIQAYGHITNMEAQSITNAHRNTISSDFTKLVADGILAKFGTGKGSRYHLIESLIFSSDQIESIFSKIKKKESEKYFQKQNRKKVFFNKTFEKALNANFSYPKDIEESFNTMKGKIEKKRFQLSVSERKRKKEKLVIDLSWASSNIEGNTYSLLETQNLIKHNETALGKSPQDAQMIMNHKKAIEYIRKGHHYKRPTKTKIFELHQLLINNLDITTGLRTHLVAISNSSFIPCDNQFQIASFFDDMLQKLNSTKSILEKITIANLLIAYLQPFADGNKRTSRMLGNAILLSYDFIPISFTNTPKEEYIKAILYFYERQEAAYFKQLLLEELNNSFQKYID